MVPQGSAGPKEAEALHAGLNAVPEMQHWPGGNNDDMAPDAAVTQQGVSARFRPPSSSYRVVMATPLCSVARFVRRLDRETANTSAVSSSEMGLFPRSSRRGDPTRSTLGGSPMDASAQGQKSAKNRKSVGKYAHLFSLL